MADIEFTFPSTDQASDCMSAIDKIAKWEVARQYGCATRRLWITDWFLKETYETQAKIMALIYLHGGKKS